MSLAPSRSAIVRDTRKILSYALAERFIFSISLARNEVPSLSSPQNSFSPRTLSSLLDAMRSFLYRSAWRLRAASTRERIAAEGSPEVAPCISNGASGGTDTWRSRRSKRGPEIFRRYDWIWPMLHMHGLVGWPKYPHLHGFIAAISMKRDG